MRLILVLAGALIATATIQVSAATAAPTATSGAHICEDDSGGDVDNRGGSGWVDSNCRRGGGATQRDLWGWFCRGLGDYIKDVTEVRYYPATFGEYVNEAQYPSNST